MGEDHGITMLVKSMPDGSRSVSVGEGRGDFLEERTTGNTNIRQFLRKVADEHFTTAVKVLSSFGVTPYCNDTIKALETKHPYKPPPSMPSNTFLKPPLVAEIDSVFGWIKSFPKDIYAAGFENRPPMLNKENYVPWSSRLLWYAKSRPNGKLIHNSIINGPYVRRMIPEPEADDQAIQIILLGLPEDIYAAEKKAKLFNEWERFTSNDGESIESYYHRFLKLMNDLKRNKHFPEKIVSNLKFLNNLQPEWSRHVTIVHQKKDLHTADYTQLYDFLKYNQKEVDLTTVMNMALALMAKAFKLNYSTPTNNNQRISSNPRNRQIAQPGTLNGYNDVQNVGNQVAQNAIQNLRVQNVENQNRLIGVPGNANQNGNGNLVAARTEGNATGHNGNQIRCYNYRGEEARIQLQAEEFDLMAAASDLDEIEEVNANCILMANLQQASTSGTQTYKAHVYDSDGSAEVHDYENCYDNEIFNMFTQEEQYTELLEPIPESHQVPQNDNNVIFEDSSVEQSGETVEQYPANVEETRALYDSLYQNLAIEVEKVNSVNRKLKETNAKLTTELARFKNQEKCFEISQEKYDKLERCYKKSVYQEQCLSKKINALHLSSGKQIMTKS
nr:putative reverse transcriptase domain-containing protein [Tanacetum cinerariifolium]